MNSKITCKHCDECSAPICPMLLDEQNSEAIWYPDEEICRIKKGVPDWVNQQKKIAQKAMPDNHDLYFLLEMLKVPFRVTTSVKGLDPDLPLDREIKQLKLWHQKNKGTRKRRLSDKQRDKKRKDMALARLAKQKKGNENVEKAA